MTLQRAAGPTQYEMPVPPAGGLQEVKEWMRQTLQRLESQAQRPTVQSLILVRVESASDPVLTRPADGMVIYTAADVLGVGTPSGFYGYAAGTWKPMTS